MLETPLYQYQIKAEVPPSTFPSFAKYESAWHQPLSEPVRQKINPQLAVALLASGLIAPVLNPSTQITQKYESRWHHAWSEPVRLKPGVRAHLQQSIAFIDSPVFQLNTGLVRYQPWSEPLYPKKGIKHYLQQPYTMPPRLLPTPNILGTMNAIETLKDVALFGIDISINVPKTYVLFAGANVTITNVPAIKGGALSIEEET